MGRPKKEISDYDVEQAVKVSTSLAQVLVELGYAYSGRNYTTVRKRVLRLGLDISHFGHDKSSTVAIPLEKILVENSSYSKNTRLKRLLVEAKIKTGDCEVCGLIPKWNDKPLVMQLDHINGVRSDNRLENLRIVCPNCHSQTDTFCRGDITFKVDANEQG